MRNFSSVINRIILCCHYFVALKKRTGYCMRNHKIFLSTFFSRHLAAVFPASFNVVKVFADHLPGKAVLCFYDNFPVALLSPYTAKSTIIASSFAVTQRQNSNRNKGTGTLQLYADYYSINLTTPLTTNNTSPIRILNSSAPAGIFPQNQSVLFGSIQRTIHASSTSRYFKTRLGEATQAVPNHKEF